MNSTVFAQKTVFLNKVFPNCRIEIDYILLLENLEN
jgi:hypothetical protein